MLMSPFCPPTIQLCCHETVVMHRPLTIGLIKHKKTLFAVNAKFGISNLIQVNHIIRCRVLEDKKKRFSTDLKCSAQESIAMPLTSICIIYFY